MSTRGDWGRGHGLDSVNQKSPPFGDHSTIWQAVHKLRYLLAQILL